MSTVSIYGNLPEPLRTRAIEMHGALHTVWTKAVGVDGYVKQEWSDLDVAIGRLISIAERAPPMKPAERGCDARKCSKHVYKSNCEFCCLPMNDHEPAL